MRPRKSELSQRSLSLSLALVLLLAAWLGLAQTVVAAHDAVHHAHVHVDLCDMLSTQGNGAALLPAAISLASPLAAYDREKISRAHFAAISPWPAFHSRAPPR